MVLSRHHCGQMEMWPWPQGSGTHWFTGTWSISLADSLGAPPMHVLINTFVTTDKILNFAGVDSRISTVLAHQVAGLDRVSYVVACYL